MTEQISQKKAWVWAAVGIAALPVCTLLCIALGTVRIPPLTVLRCLLCGLGLYPTEAVDAVQRTAVLLIRLPRVLVGGLAGAGLSVAGVVMQGVFRNPLAEPGVLGVSAGASLGALLAITLGLIRFASIPVFGFVGAMVAMLMILGVSLRTRSVQGSAGLVMSGMAVSAMFSALTSLVLTHANEYQVANYIFWTMGGLANRRWEHLRMLAVPVCFALAALAVMGRRLDLLLLGDEQARALGAHPGRTRVLLVTLASLCAAAVVSVTGPIGFVGLIVPHMLRMLLGPSNRRLMLASALGGAVFLMLCDLLVRLLGSSRGNELPVGIVTALMGAPFFLALLLRRSGRGASL